MIDWKVIVLDESTCIKNPQAKTSRFVHALCHRARRVYALSGCPTPNHEKDAWSQVHAAAPGTFEDDFHAFMGRRFYQPRPIEHPWLWAFRRGERARYMAELKTTSTFLRKSDCLDLPLQTDVIHHVDLDKEELETYRQFLRDWIVRVEGGVIVGRSALAELMKSRQMTAGIARSASGDWLEIGRTKMDTVLDLADGMRDPLTGNTRPILVVGEFRYELERYHKAFVEAKRSPRILYGGLSRDARQDVIRSFKSGKANVLLAHPQSAAHCLTLVNCSEIIFASLSYSYEHYSQMRDRIHRIGQKMPCTYHHIIAKDTIDERIIEALGRKQSVTSDLVDFFRRRVAS